MWEEIEGIIFHNWIRVTETPDNSAELTVQDLIENNMVPASEDNLEMFRDRSYFNEWAIRRKDERELEQTVYLTKYENALALFNFLKKDA